jgi:hypothetical protein
MRPRYLIVVTGVVLLAAPNRGLAQFPTPPRGPSGPTVARPAFSPYLNLARQDVPAAINYYGLVRPQIATYQSLQSLQQQITTVAQAEAGASQGLVDPGLPVTGQPVSFLNHGGYFLTQRAGPVAPNRGAGLGTAGQGTPLRAPGPPPRR